MEVLRRSIPQAGDDGLRLLARIGRIDPTSLPDFLASGGYRALSAAIELGPTRTIEEVITAEVLGRGGAAFPAGRKWAAAAASKGLPKNIVCNADEAEPGTFKDRAILEEDPFSLVEAMTIAGFATGAELGFLYIRGEYPLGEARMANAIARSREAGYLGRDILGAGFAFDIEIRRGGGAYICGEGTALYESIEGKRGEPRNKAERSTTSGLFQKPTVVNNVETLVNIPGIVLDGGAEYATLGTDLSNGHKLFSISGHVARPGVYETEFGITIRDLIELAGGVPGGRAIKAINVGGAAGVFVGPDAIHMPLTFEHAKEMGATLGAGAVVVFDETTDILDILRRIAQFFRDESCGQCVPCRVGTVRQEELLARLMAGQPERLRGRRARPAARPGPGHARRVHLRPRPDRQQRDRERPPAARGDGSMNERETPASVPVNPILLNPPARPDPSAGSAAPAARAEGGSDDRRPSRRGSGRLHDPRCVSRQGDRHADAVLRREPRPGRRLPGVRGRSGRRAGAGAGLLAQARGWAWTSRPTRNGSVTRASSCSSCSDLRSTWSWPVRPYRTVRSPPMPSGTGRIPDDSARPPSRPRRTSGTPSRRVTITRRTERPAPRPSPSR